MFSCYIIVVALPQESVLSPRLKLCLINNMNHKSTYNSSEKADRNCKSNSKDVQENNSASTPKSL